MKEDIVYVLIVLIMVSLLAYVVIFIVKLLGHPFCSLDTSVRSQCGEKYALVDFGQSLRIKELYHYR